MNKKILIGALISFSAFSSSLHAQEISDAVYTCKSHGSTGFRSVGRSWVASEFNNMSTYVLAKRVFRGDETYYIYDVTNGNKLMLAYKKAEEMHSHFISFDFGGLFGNFSIRKDNLRFSRVSEVGYMSGNKSATPFMEIGYCQRT